MQNISRYHTHIVSGFDREVKVFGYILTFPGIILTLSMVLMERWKFGAIHSDMSRYPTHIVYGFDRDLKVWGNILTFPGILLTLSLVLTELKVLGNILTFPLPAIILTLSLVLMERGKFWAIFWHFQISYSHCLCFWRRGEHFRQCSELLCSVQPEWLSGGVTGRTCL